MLPLPRLVSITTLFTSQLVSHGQRDAGNTGAVDEKAAAKVTRFFAALIWSLQLLLVLLLVHLTLPSGCV